MSMCPKGKHDMAVVGVRPPSRPERYRDYEGECRGCVNDRQSAQKRFDAGLPTLGRDSAEAVLHGYAMTDIDRLARTVAFGNRKWLADTDPKDAMERAWEGIVTALCEATEQPSEQDLLMAGWYNLKRDQAAHRVMIGKLTTSEGYSVQFERYWHSPPTAFEDALVEHIGFQQAWAGLRDYHRETFVALADAGFRQQGAADILGVDKRTAKRRIALGYAAFCELWYEGETPPPRARESFDRPEQRGENNSLNKWRDAA